MSGQHKGTPNPEKVSAFWDAVIDWALDEEIRNPDGEVARGLAQARAMAAEPVSVLVFLPATVDAETL